MEKFEQNNFGNDINSKLGKLQEKVVLTEEFKEGQFKLQETIKNYGDKKEEQKLIYGIEKELNISSNIS